MTGLAVPLGPAKGVRGLERVLLEHLADRPTGDSYLATLIDRPLSRPLTRLLLRTSLTPSHVTLLGMACGLLGAAGLATVSYWGRLVGVALLIMSIVLDCVDGDMARAKLEQVPPAPASTSRVTTWCTSRPWPVSRSASCARVYPLTAFGRHWP
jgi:hypothetical protein